MRSFKVHQLGAKSGETTETGDESLTGYFSASVWEAVNKLQLLPVLHQCILFLDLCARRRTKTGSRCGCCGN